MTYLLVTLVAVLSVATIALLGYAFVICNRVNKKLAIQKPKREIKITVSYGSEAGDANLVIPEDITLGAMRELLRDRLQDTNSPTGMRQSAMEVTPTIADVIPIRGNRANA